MRHPPAPRYLDARALDALGIDARSAVDAVEDALRARAAGRLWSAPKSSLQLPDGRFVMSTLGVSADPSWIVVKSLALNPRNPDAGLPLINALVTVLEGETGVPVAVLDGNWITEVRTAALSAVAARHLARPDARTIAFVGCGAQARAHLATFAALYPLRRVQLHGRGARNRQRLCAQARSLGLEAVDCEAPREAITGADIVVTAVTHAVDFEPFLDARWLSRGSYAAITDLARPWLPDTLGAFDKIVIDDLAQEATMARPMVPPERVAGDVGGLVNAELAAPAGEGARTAFVFRGMAAADVALAGLVLARLSRRTGSEHPDPS